MKKELRNLSGYSFIFIPKDDKKRFTPWRSIKTFSIMRLTSIFLLFAFLQVNAGGISKKVTLNEKNAQLEKVFIEIRKQTGYDFLYNNRLLKDTRPVTIKVANELLENVLPEIFRSQPITYSILENTIILKRREEQLSSQTPSFSMVSMQTAERNPAPDNVVKRLSGYSSIQRAVVTGKVTGSKNEPLEGVSVRVKDSEVGTSTNNLGNFTITAPDNSTLVFSYVGYTTQEVAVDGRTSISVQLQEDQKSMSDVVVTAFGLSRRKKALAYSVTEVKGDEFTQARENNVANALTGKIAGVDATQISAGPGASSRVVIRGNGALSGNQQPLYVVNGQPINNVNRSAAANTVGTNVDRGDGIQSINPDDIESISVLKGGAAAALYGSQAANGVILITTKQGRAQKGIGIEYTSNMVVQTPSDFPEWQYVYGQGNDGVKPANRAAALSSGRLSFGAKIDGQPSLQFDGVMRPYSAVNVKDNIKNFFRKGTSFTNTLAFSGGSQALTYRLSLSNLHSNSLMRKSDYDRRTANLSVRSILAKKITIESTIQYNDQKAKNRPTVGYAEVNPAWATYLLANTVDIRNLAPGYDPATGIETEWNPVPAANNPYFIMNRVGNGDERQRLITQGSIRYDILPNLFVKANILRDFEAGDEFQYLPWGTAYVPQGNYQSGTSDITKTNAQVIVNYNAEFLKNFSINAMAGGNQERDVVKSTFLNGTQFVIPDFISYTNLAAINSGQDQIRRGTNSLFGSADLGFKDLLYISATGRQDWFSTLNPGNNSIFYPSIGGSFVLSEVLNLPSTINFVKLRSSWAQVGSATVGAGSINQVYTFQQGGHNGRPVQNTASSLNNPNLRPLTSRTIEGGIDVQMFGRRLGMDLTYYNRKTTDDIITVAVSNASGYTGSQMNIGAIKNEGIELMLTGRPMVSKNFSWEVTANGAYNNSEILKLAPGISSLSIQGGIGGATIINAIGEPYGTVRAWVMKKDANGVQVYNKATGYEDRVEVNLGVGNPPLTLGLNNEFRFKNFTGSILLDGKFGHVVYNNLMQYAHRFGLTKETLPGREGGLTVSGVDQTGARFTKTWPVEQLDTYYNNQGQYTGLFVYDADFVKLRSLIIGYNIPVDRLKRVKLQSANISLVSRNLAILYRHNKNFDPEASYQTGNAQGLGAPTLPRTRDIGVNLNVRF